MRNNLTFMREYSYICSSEELNSYIKLYRRKYKKNTKKIFLNIYLRRAARPELDRALSEEVFLLFTDDATVINSRKNEAIARANMEGT